MRRGRTYWVLLFNIGVLTIAFVISYLSWISTLTSWARAADFGREFFWVLMFAQLSLVVVLAPAFTCGSVSAERERQTLDMLQVTMLLPQNVVLGKLTSALSYVALLTVSSIPLLAISFLFGGVSPGELVLAYVILWVTALFLGLVGMFFSTVARRTITATALAYGVTIFLCMGTAVLDAMVVPRPGGDVLFSYLNPFMAMASVMAPGALGTAYPMLAIFAVLGYGLLQISFGLLYEAGRRSAD